MADQSRRKAGKQVRGFTEDMSAKLLAIENTQAGKVDKLFADTVVDLPKDKDKVGKQLREKVYAAHDEACDGCYDIMETVVKRAQKAGLSYGHRQLVAVDKSRSKKDRYAAKAYKSVRDDQLDLQDHWRRILKAAIEDAKAGFHDDWRHQRSKAGDGRELKKRIWSPDPVQLEGLSGRGVVWRTASSVRTEVRHASVHVVNTVLDDLMVAYNWLEDQG